MPREDYGEDSLDETVRNLRVLAEAPGDLRFRQRIADGFDKVNDKLTKIQIELTEVKGRLIPRVEIAGIAQKEMAVLVEKVDKLERTVWFLCGAFATALIVIGVARVFGK